VELEKAARQVLPELESEPLRDEEHGPVIQNNRTRGPCNVLQVLFEGAEEENRINLLSRKGLAMGGVLDCLNAKLEEVIRGLLAQLNSFAPDAGVEPWEDGDGLLVG
jgi:hypothetical protein